MLKIREILIRLRTSFWFIPTMCVALTICLAMVLIEVDSHKHSEFVQQSPRLFGVGAEGARGMLSTIAGSIMTMMGVIFSMTLVTLSLASSQYSSRVLRNFIRNRKIQTVLGIFASIYTYCLIVLRTIRSDNHEFIPHLSIFVGFLLALVGVFVLILFIHHVATNIQASNIIFAVAQETEKGITELFPEEINDDSYEENSEEKPTEDMKPIVSDRTGYIQTLSIDTIIEFAREVQGSIMVNFAIGEFVVKNTPLIYVAHKEDFDEKDIRRIQRSFSIQEYRTIEQDTLFGVRQLVDISLKALSPGVNDTTTAIVCIDYLTGIVARLVPRRMPSAKRKIDNGISVIIKRPIFQDYLVGSFSQIRDAGKSNYAVMERLLWAYKLLYDQTQNFQRRDVITSEAKKVMLLIEESFSLDFERRKLMDQYNDVFNKTGMRRNDYFGTIRLN